MWKTKCLEARLKITVPWFKGTLYSGRESFSEKLSLNKYQLYCSIQYVLCVKTKNVSQIFL